MGTSFPWIFTIPVIEAFRHTDSMINMFKMDKDTCDYKKENFSTKINNFNRYISVYFIHTVHGENVLRRKIYGKVFHCLVYMLNKCSLSFNLDFHFISLIFL